MKKVKEKMLNIAIPEDLHRILKMHAVENGTTMKSLIIDFIKSLKKRNKN